VSELFKLESPKILAFEQDLEVFNYIKKRFSSLKSIFEYQNSNFKKGHFEAF
jgi:hypothetical protein